MSYKNHLASLKAERDVNILTEHHLKRIGVPMEMQIAGARSMDITTRTSDPKANPDALLAYLDYCKFLMQKYESKLETTEILLAHLNSDLDRSNTDLWTNGKIAGAVLTGGLAAIGIHLYHRSQKKTSRSQADILQQRRTRIINEFIAQLEKLMEQIQDGLQDVLHLGNNATKSRKKNRHRDTDRKFYTPQNPSQLERPWKRI